MLSAKKVSNLRASFPVPKLILITSAPTYQTIQILQMELNSNVVSVHSPNATFGHLALKISQLEYLLKNANPFPVPVNPSICLSVIQRKTTANITHAHHFFNIDRNIYDNYQTTDKALKHNYLRQFNTSTLNTSTIKTSNSVESPHINSSHTYRPRMGT